MTLGLDPPVRIGDVTVAAIVEQHVHALPAPVLGLHGGKRTVALLVRRGGTVLAYDAAAGAELSTTEVDRLYPGQRLAFEQA